jgi:hypothetical protein
MGLFSKKKKAGGAFQFRISDAVAIPRRGYLLRLKVLSGTPDIDDLGPGSRIRVTAPDGKQRMITVRDFSVTGGVQSQERLERYRELDIIVDHDDGYGAGEEIQIGWVANGPTDD